MKLDKEFLPPSFSDHALKEGTTQCLGGNMCVCEGSDPVEGDLDGFSMIWIHHCEFEKTTMPSFEVCGRVLLLNFSSDMVKPCEGFLVNGVNVRCRDLDVVFNRDHDIHPNVLSIRNPNDL